MRANNSMATRYPNPDIIRRSFPGIKCSVNPPAVARMRPPAAIGANHAVVISVSLPRIVWIL